jgi:putative transposase
MTHVRTSPFYPQSNGKLERFHGTIKDECIRPGVPLSLDDARRMVESTSNTTTTSGCTAPLAMYAPADKLTGRDQEIFKERDRKLEEARELRKQKRQQAFPEITGFREEADLPLDQAALKVHFRLRRDKT